MTIATSPAPPRRMLDGEVREVWSVTVDCVRVGTIERDKHLDWRWRLNAMADSLPARLGLRTNAVEDLVRAAGLPSGWRHQDRWHRVPQELVIVRRPDGSVRADGEGGG